MRLIKILVIEEEAQERALVEGFFLKERLCNRVDYAEDMAHAQAMLEQGVAYDLILLDVCLGARSGFELMPLIRRTQPMARLVFLSGEDSAECLFRAREAGADFFVEKPMNTDGLRYILQRVHHLWIGVMTEAGFPLARE